MPKSGNLVDIQGDVLENLENNSDSEVMMKNFEEKINNPFTFINYYTGLAYTHSYRRGKRSLNQLPPIPKEFDLRNDRNCGKYIAKVQNQGDCANCWAHVAAQVSSDVMCITSKGKTLINSPMHLWSCCPECTLNEKQPNCQPGFGNRGFDYFLKNGLATSQCYIDVLSKSGRGTSHFGVSYESLQC